MVPLKLTVSRSAAREIAARECEFRWPTPWQDYDFISGELLSAVVGAAESFGSRASHGDRRAAALPWIVVAEIFGDFARAATAALDLHNLCAAGQSVTAHARDYPLLVWMMDGGEAPPHFLRDRMRWPVRPGERERRLASIKRILRRARMTFILPHRRFDLIGTNDLLDEFAKTRGRRLVDLYLRLLGIPEKGELPATLMNEAPALIDAFIEVMEPRLDGDRELTRSLRQLATYSVHLHLGRAWAGMTFLQTSGLHQRIADSLVGGAPKSIGRLLAWYYQEHGKRVYRFAHGGDRGFFVDRAWSLSELPFCNHYYCHGSGEAEHLHERHSRFELAPIGSETPAFLSLGSRRHRAIVESSRRPTMTSRGERRRILYVAGLYSSEHLAQVPTFKPPDMLYLEWQVWLLKTLRKAGCSVFVKSHPRGMIDGRDVLRDFCDGTIGGYFDGAADDYDCLLFDFAGSAWFDALASQHGIVFINIGFRPIDAKARVDLNMRCVLVECQMNERNCFRVAPHCLVEAIEAATAHRGCPPEFANKYFSAESSSESSGA